jgi:hypothetical protein
MNIDDLQGVWNSSSNGPTSAESERLTKHFIESLFRQRRHQLAWLTWTFFSLTVITGFVGWLIFGTDKVDPTLEWGVIPLLLVPWTFAFYFLKRYRKPTAPVVGGDVAIVDALIATKNAIRAKQTGLKAICVMFLIFLPLLAVSISQLYAAGKASSRELISMVVFLGGACAVSGIGVVLRYCHLLRQRKQLEKILRQFEQATAE